MQVALQGVDLSIMRQQVKRLSQSPARERVGAVAAVHQRQGRLHSWIVQVRKIDRQLIGLEHPLVDDRAGAATGDREAQGVVADAFGIGPFFGPPADHVKLPLEQVSGSRFLATANE